MALCLLMSLWCVCRQQYSWCHAAVEHKMPSVHAETASFIARCFPSFVTSMAPCNCGVSLDNCWCCQWSMYNCNLSQDAVSTFWNSISLCLMFLTFVIRSLALFLCVDNCWCYQWTVHCCTGAQDAVRPRWDSVVSRSMFLQVHSHHAA